MYDLEIAVTILAGLALIVYGAHGFYNRVIGWSIGPFVTEITGVPGTVFSLSCMLGGLLLAIPLLVALLSGQATNTLLIQIATTAGLPVVIVGFIFAILVQLALDLGNLIARFRKWLER